MRRRNSKSNRRHSFELLCAFKKAGVSNLNIEPENAFVLFGSLKGCGILNAQIELRKCVCIVWQFLIERDFQNADRFQKKF